mgnify:CR=1 FL=1
MENYKKYVIVPMDFEHAGSISSRIKQELLHIKISKATMRRILTAAYEAEMNVCIHSLGGVGKYHIAQNQIQMIFEDFGPGIEDIEQSLIPGFSTANKEAIQNGFGSGMGMVHMKSVADSFEIKSTKNGTIISIIINL